jgi:p-hydroxybenzoate 3-monooxygenase
MITTLVHDHGGCPTSAVDHVAWCGAARRGWLARDDAGARIGGPMRTQIGIIGAGPAGLLLSHLLAQHGIESVIVENRSRAYVEARVRAGVLEQGTVELLTAVGAGERLHREGLRHDGIHLQWPGERHHLDFPDLCGRSVWIYGQTEVVKDLIHLRSAAGQQLHFEVSDTAVQDVDTDRPRITFTDSGGAVQELVCDLVAGCDGFHGVSRPAIPQTVRGSWDRTYPFAWLGILADVPPSSDELIYAWHPDGFALHSMRSPTVSRLYLQVAVDERIDDWSDDRIWSQLARRFALDGWTLREGPIREKSITPMRSFVRSPMRHGRLLLAGDAAHIVPPTGAKGLNLAVADVRVLAEAVVAFIGKGSTDLLDAYSDTALRRVWRCTHFSWWMTSMLHVAPPGTDAQDAAFEQQLQLSQLRYVTSSRAAAASLAQNYTGLPFEGLDPDAF